jgi:hypothetical protein
MAHPPNSILLIPQMAYLLEREHSQTSAHQLELGTSIHRIAAKVCSRKLKGFRRIKEVGNSRDFSSTFINPCVSCVPLSWGHDLRSNVGEGYVYRVPLPCAAAFSSGKSLERGGVPLTLLHLHLQR